MDKVICRVCKSRDAPFDDSRLTGIGWVCPECFSIYTTIEEPLRRYITNQFKERLLSILKEPDE